MTSRSTSSTRSTIVKSFCAVLVVVCALLVVVAQQGWGNGSSRAMDHLKNGTQNEQIDAIRTLGHQRNDPEALKALLGALDDRDAAVRRETVIALRNWRFTASTAPVVAAISARLLDDDIYVRYAAADTLLHYFPADALDPVRNKILPALVKHEDLLDRGGFAFVAASFHSSGPSGKALAAATLTELLSARRAIHRIHAMLLLDHYREHAGPATIPALLEIVRKQPETESFTAAVLLAKLLAERPEMQTNYLAIIRNLPATSPVKFLRERLEDGTSPT